MIFAGSQIGAYRILQRIGVGGMGEVWLAEHAMLGRRAAIKVLRPELSQNQQMVTRFFNEARATTAIADPGIVQVFDFGRDTDGSAYLVMELLEGDTLDTRMKQGALAIGDGLRIMRQVASTVGAAHAAGIIHRDLKPENIFLVRDREVPGGERAKILDFGIAKLVGDSSITQTSAVLGTPTYMSPEQCSGARDVDARADVYSLGCVLFALVAGRPPFEARGAGDMIAMHLREPAPLASTLVTAVPRELDDLIARCLAKDPEARFASGSELAAAIGTLAAGSYRIMVAGPGVAIVSGGTTLSTAASQVQLRTPARRRRALALALAAGVAVAGGAAAAVMLSNESSKPTTKATAVVAPVPQPAPPIVEPAPPIVEPAPPPPKQIDPVETTTQQLASGLVAFVAWAKTHAGAACPTASQLDLADDAWGHPIEITCTDQPSNQIVGMISIGPDGKRGTSDDVASWKQDASITSVVRGARWRTSTVRRPNPERRNPTKPLDLDNDGIPSSR